MVLNAVSRSFRTPRSPANNSNTSAAESSIDNGDTLQVDRKKRVKEGKMNHLIQVARRTGKSAMGYKVQLVVHRMSAHLPASYDGAELCAVITRHKKKVVTKCGCYLADKKEVVWGDILPFTCTLYLAKTGLYQAKVFTVQVFDTRTDHQIATFEFNLAEMVQSNKDSSKESLMVPAVKCQDPRASLSVTAISTKATSKTPRMPGEPEGSNFDEMSFDGSRSDMSVITLESKSSRASMTSASRYGRQQGGATSPSSNGDSKSDVLRGAFPAGDSNDAVELYNLRSKHQELLHSLQEMEEKLRLSENENAKLEKKVGEKDQVIQRIQAEKDEMEQHLQEAQRGAGGSSASADDGGSMRVDFMKYMTLKEEKDGLQKQLDELKETVKKADEQRKLEAIPPIAVTVNKVSGGGDSDESDSDSDSDEEEEEDEKEEEAETHEDKRSEASSVNEYVDAHDVTQLITEINELKATLATMKSDRDSQQSLITNLTKLKEELAAQLHSMEGKISTLESENATQRRHIEEQEDQMRSRNVVDDEEEEAEQRLRAESSEVRVENEKLVQQLSHLDHIVTQLKDEKAALAEKLKQAESSQSRAQKDMEDAQEAIGQLSGTNQEIVEKLQVAQEATERAKQEIESAQLTIDELRDQVREISEKLQTTQIELERLRDVELVSSAAAAAAAIAKNQELQGRWDDLKLQNDQLQTRVDELEEKLAQTEASGEEREADLQRQVEELKQETAQLRAELEDLRASKQEAEEELHDRTVALKNALENQQRQSQDHDHQVGGLQMEKEDARSRIEEQIRLKEAADQELKRRVTELEQENDYFQGELIDSKMKLAELMVKNEELSSQYHRVEKNLNELKAKAAEPPAPAGKKK